MTDEAPREVVPLQREVEAPRTGAGLWMPMMGLASAAMLTIVSAIAVMSRPPRAVVVVEQPARAPIEIRREQIERQRNEARERMEHDSTRVMCRAAVYRGNLDAEPQPYDECIVPRDLAPVTHARPPESH